QTCEKVAMTYTQGYVEKKIRHRKVVLFEKSSVPSCKQCRVILESYGLNKDRQGVFETVNIEARTDCSQLEDYLLTKTLFDRREVPHLFVDGRHIGGEFEIKRFHESGELKEIFRKSGITGLA
ncbi:hypothetical protein BOX15_Mlig001738g7, partial [Macrostomum lignano]